VFLATFLTEKGRDWAVPLTAREVMELGMIPPALREDDPLS
jgi:hypothetical protein